MRPRGDARRVPAVAVAVMVTVAAPPVGLGVAGCGGGAGVVHPQPRIVAAPRSATTLRLGPAGRRIPNGFLGLSIEFQAIRAYTGTDPRHVNPVFEALVRGLSPGQRPVLRIGGDSTDASWTPAAGVRPPRFAGYRYPLTPGWYATTGALVHALDARLTVGLNLAAGDPAIDTAEASAARRTFGPGTLSAFELGNEPNLYATVPEQKLADGTPVVARPHGYGPAGYRRQVAAVIAAVRRVDPGATFAGPALAADQDPDPAGRWIRTMRTFLRDAPAVTTLTVHRYPLKRCFRAPHSPQDPSIHNLLAPYATRGLAAGAGLWVRLAAAEHRSLRIDELNSVACRGQVGVSNTFASALWMTQALFSLAAAGVDGVNVHTLPDSYYEPFAFTERDGRFRARVLPEYYGMELFARAAPPGARLVSVQGAPSDGSLGAWATRAPDGTTRIVLVNPASGRARTVRIPVGARGGGDGRGDRATVQRLTAPSLTATGGVSLGGRTFGSSTTTGVLGAARTTLAPRTRSGALVVRLPAASAALVTLAR